MRVRRVVMIVVMMVIITVMVVVVVIIGSLQAAHPRAERVTQFTIHHVGAGRIRTLTFDMVVVTFLHGTDFALETQNGSAVLAKNASRWWYGPKRRVFAIFCTNLAAFATFQRKHLATIATDAAIGWGCRADLLHDALCKGFQHLWMIA